MSAPSAGSLNRGGAVTTQTSAGTTQATAAPLVADHVKLVSVGSNSGVKLPLANAGEWFTIHNGDGSNALKVYHPNATSGLINSSSSAYSVGAGKTALFLTLNAVESVALGG